MFHTWNKKILKPGNTMVFWFCSVKRWFLTPIAGGGPPPTSHNRFHLPSSLPTAAHLPVTNHHFCLKYSPANHPSSLLHISITEAKAPHCLLSQLRQTTTKLAHHEPPSRVWNWHGGQRGNVGNRHFYRSPLRWSLKSNRRSHFQKFLCLQFAPI